MNQTISLPPLDTVASACHDSWMQIKLKAGITSRKAEDGEELMVPFDKLSEKQKDMDRSLVRTVYEAIEKSL